MRRHCRLQSSNILLDGLPVLPCDWTRTGRLRNRGGTLVRLGVFGEVRITQPWACPYDPLTLKAREALFDVRGILRALLLSVIDDVQTNVDLLLHDFLN